MKACQRIRLAHRFTSSGTCLAICTTQSPEPLRQLLRESGWLDIKLSKCGPHALLQDFDFAPVDEGLTLLARTIDMCRHIFVTDPVAERPASRRLQPDKSPGLEKLLADCRNWTGAAQLKPLTNSLPPPGNLVRVFPGHTDILQMCAFSGDGTRLLSASATGRPVSGGSTARPWPRWTRPRVRSTMRRSVTTGNGS